jgi:hypothetical protein
MTTSLKIFCTKNQRIEFPNYTYDLLKSGREFNNELPFIIQKNDNKNLIIEGISFNEDNYHFVENCQKNGIHR